ncbi:MAG: dihydropteroate synthase [Chloroflexota bacterium]|jgi:dihydropteroate synthase|nr:dihydropteroate synthase [Chloroflexota bacterium]MDH5243055.1 dihydropteroate synthase [Chloroflexota bacterium]
MRIGPRLFAWGDRTYVMGIVNATPDSFSGDGLLADGDGVDRAVDQARRMVAEGADLLDIGGESTRPGHAPVDAAAETARVLPIVRAVRAALPGTPISIDTTKPEVAEAALAAGANLLNDVWGTAPDGAALAAVAATHRVPLILMHNRREPVYDDVVAEVVTDLAAAIERAVRVGMSPQGVIVDPGIGFGKTADQNVTLLRGLAALRSLGRPILLGTSRKSTLGRIVDLPPADRLEATLATTALGIVTGVDMIRVHDVQPNVRVARVADAIVRGTWRAEPPEGGHR